MKLCCGSVRTIKGAIALFSFCIIFSLFLRLFRISLACAQDVTNCIVVGITTGVLVVLLITVEILRRTLPTCFPVACGHRRCVFTGRSSKSLQEILLLVGNKIPTEEELHQVKDNALPYLHDIKTELEKTMKGRNFHFFFSGSVVERYGMPLMLSDKTCAAFSLGPLHTDLDVMICSTSDKACFSGQGNVLVKPLFTDGVGFTGYAKLTTLTPAFEAPVSISSRHTMNSVKAAVNNVPIANLPGKPCCVLAPKIQLDSKGPALKIRIPALFEVDITFCIHCPEWPITSDWPSRPRYWPSLVDVQRIMSLGCHLVAKPAPSDKDQGSWRFSFSLAELELSKLVPDVARKCYLALKIILRDHLQPVVPEIGSYHIKTIFLNTVEKLPVGFWVEDNIEECFVTLLAELQFALGSMKCIHHWFSSVNLFSIKAAKKLQLLAKKVRRIQKDPSPFILDDGCCCLSSCCVRVPPDDFTRRGSQEILIDYDEIAICVCDNENATTRVQDPRNLSFQSPVSESMMPNVTDISLPPNEEKLPSQKEHGLCPDEDKMNSFGP